MDPVSISMAATLGAGAVGAAGSLFSGSAGQAAANYQAGIAQMNAQIAQQNANFELSKGEAEAEQSGMKSRFQIGEAKATQAASGGDVNRGSNVLVRGSMSQVANLNEATIRNNAARKAWGFQTEAAGDEAQAALDRMKGSAAKTTGEFGAASSILGSIGSVAGKWSTASTSGWQGPKFASAGNDLLDMFGFGKQNDQYQQSGKDASGDEGPYA